MAGHGAKVIIGGGESKPFSLLHRLPPPPDLVGRDEELADLLKKLTSDHAGGAAILGARAGLQGMGGVGKTALATVLAHRLVDRYPDAQLYFNLRGADPERRPPVAPAEAMRNIIQTFHPEAKLPEALDELTPCYHSVLAQAGRVMLFLDNAADENQIRPLLPPPNCLLLVTSRRQFTLPGLASRNVDCLQPDKARELLLKLAERIAGHAEDAAELCGCLPLALEVFAGVVNRRNLTPVPELLQRLRQRQDKLDPVNTAFQVSYDLLEESLRRQWAMLGVFPASFNLLAAAVVWGIEQDAAREAMQTLCNSSLVEYNSQNGRFRLHDLVREFCLGKLSADEQTTAQLRHAAHYRDVGGAADQLYLEGGDKVLRGLELFDRERTHIEAAFEFLAGCVRRESVQGPVVQNAATLLLSLVEGVTYVGSLRFHPRQRIGWLEAQRDAARLVKDRQREGAALGNLGNANRALGDVRKAIEFYEQALVINREFGDWRGVAADLSNLGNAYAVLGVVRMAIEFYQQALVIDREFGDRRGEAADLSNLGITYFALGDARKPIEFYEQALVIAREIGDWRAEGSILGNFGNAYLVLGDARKAIEFYEQRLKIAREIGDRQGEGKALGNLGNAYTILGDARKAIEFYEQHLKIAREIGDRRGEGGDLWNSALALNKLGEHAQAIARAENALKIFEAIEDPNAAKVRAALAIWRTAK